MTEPSRDGRAAAAASRIAAAPQSHDEILGLIRRARRRYRGRLSGGNCGQFAYALGRFLGRGEIALLTESGLEEDDLRHGDADVYHALLKVDGRLYDGGGEADLAGLARLAEAEYGDPDPALWDEFPLDEDTRLVISGQTAWDIEWTDFHRFFEGLPKPGKDHRASGGLGLAAWAYHATDAAKLRAIAEEGLTPREQPEEHADEDRGEEGAVVFFCPEERLAAAWGGVVLRFPWPAESWEDPYGDATWSEAGGAGYTNHCTPLRVPPELIEAKLGGAWVPLRRGLRRGIPAPPGS